MKSREVFSRRSLTLFFHSIRFRLALWFVLILGVVMVTFSGFVYWRQAQDVRSIALGQLKLTLEHIQGSSHEGENFSEQSLQFYSTITENTRNLNTNLQGGEVLALQAADGKVMQSAGVLTAEQIQQLNLPLTWWKGLAQITIPKIQGIENNRYLFVKPEILRNGQVSGYLLVGVPLDANNQLGRLRISLIMGNLLTLAIALTGGFLLADKAMRPVHTITQAARQISETDLDMRLNLPGQDELSELANTFDDMLDRLQAAFERQRQFTADASHELRTPLTIIDLETNRGLSMRRSVDEHDRILRTIQSENTFMIRLVNNLLSLARMDAGQLNLRTDVLDLSDITLEVIERMEPIAAAQSVQLVIGDLPELLIQGDRPTLIQMLTNLVENAIKYSASVTSPQVNISAGRLEGAGQLVAWVCVSDNGIGIDSEQQAHIFDRFYQVDAARNRSDGEDELSGQDSSGTGLGLAIAQWIAKAHHGEIRVESVVGQGSTFEVILPIYIRIESDRDD
jgi:signal transduction histidine kinase